MVQNWFSIHNWYVIAVSVLLRVDAFRFMQYVFVCLCVREKGRYREGEIENEEENIFVCLFDMITVLASEPLNPASKY